MTDVEFLPVTRYGDHSVAAQREKEAVVLPGALFVARQVRPTPARRVHPSQTEAEADQRLTAYSPSPSSSRAKARFAWARTPRLIWEALAPAATRSRT